MRSYILPISFLLASAVGVAEAQVSAVQVPLETATGWGPLKAPAGYKALRIQGKTTVDALTLARLFGDFAAHPSMFPRVVDDVDILACSDSSLIARYTTKFDPKPGGKTKVESLSNVKVTATKDRVEFVWSSNEVESSYVNAALGRALFVTQRGPNGPETLIDYVSAVRPKNKAKGLLVESQKSTLAADARYVIDRLMAIGNTASSRTNSNLFSCLHK